MNNCKEKKCTKKPSFNYINKKKFCAKDKKDLIHKSKNCNIRFNNHYKYDNYPLYCVKNNEDNIKNLKREYSNQYILCNYLLDEQFEKSSENNDIIVAKSIENDKRTQYNYEYKKKNNKEQEKPINKKKSLDDYIYIYESGKIYLSL